MKSARPMMLALLAALAACGGTDEGAEGERRTAAGEVLGGTISDDMLPLDTVTSQSPPLRERSEGSASAAPDERQPGAQEAPEPAESEAAPEPGPSAAADPETEE